VKDAWILADDRLVFNIEASVYEVSNISSEELKIEIYEWLLGSY